MQLPPDLSQWRCTCREGLRQLPQDKLFEQNTFFTQFSKSHIIYRSSRHDGLLTAEKFASSQPSFHSIRRNKRIQAQIILILFDSYIFLMEKSDRNFCFSTEILVWHIYSPLHCRLWKEQQPLSCPAGFSAFSALKWTCATRLLSVFHRSLILSV